ncbi:hypothetical protein CYLTODRAFT_408861 [Cylindrobasidium torrendii FP15055 ss-10]|uniref:N-acetyltransferase domain-containing protein n=1 Tax=Cylindrobasidium torrendii FP15055 ss-10 TaxID=1314674 RepID=A0A0D7BJ68_9AGAR|nr:hypothetical protein CYLTODRAFT_408861 [Cylindrobasidium torrendii FP15055 ss-10]
MPFPSDYTIFPILQPASDDHLAKWVDLRLQGLKLDPASFSTRYEDAMKKTREEHLSRLNDPLIRTLAVETADGTWVATAAVGIFNDQSFGWVPEKLWEDGKKGFLLLGLWVHPGHRRKGLATGIIQAATDFARGYGGASGAEKYMAVEVYEDVAALKMYEGLGFKAKTSRESDGRTVVGLSRVL